MSIIEEYKKYKEYIDTGVGKQLVSRWTSSTTVECEDGEIIENKISDINNKFDSYLKLSGGTMTGSLVTKKMYFYSNDSNYTAGNIVSSNNIITLSLGNGNDTSNMSGATEDNDYTNATSIRGALNIYGNQRYYNKIISLDYNKQDQATNTGLSGNRIFYLPDRTGVGVTIAYDSDMLSGTAVGSENVPVYVSSKGEVKACTNLSATSLSFSTFGAKITNDASQQLCIKARTLDSNYGLVYGATRNSVWALTPNSDSHGQYLGSSSYKWSAIYASTGSINTSDKNYKHDIKPLDDKYIELFNRLIPVSFIFNSNTSGRTHVGFISQDVEQAMKEVGLTDLDFAGFCKDIKTEPVFNDDGIQIGTKEVYDKDGNPEYIYSLRYDEFIAINTKAIQNLTKRVEEIEKAIS